MLQSKNAVETTSSMLCDACRAILTSNTRVAQINPTNNFDNSPDNRTTTVKAPSKISGTHHVTARACKDSADRGCSICRTVWLRATEYGKLVDIFQLDVKPFSSWNVSLNGEHNPFAEPNRSSTRHTLNINIGSVLRARGLGTVQSLTYGDVEFHLETAITHQQLLSHAVTSSDTSSKDSWQRIEQWYEYCRSNCKCVGRLSGTFKPTRLIDVGESAEDLLYIRSGDALPEKISYICLSHCWGGFMAEALYDPKQEWKSMTGIPITDIDKQGFRLGERSKSFKDAVEVTRRLGKRYLWIDMLCIVQNDKVDWLQESRDMGRLFSGAYLTLIADGAQDATNGLFHSRQPAAVCPMVVRPDWNAEFSSQDWVLIPADFWRETVSESRTGKRAWCLQERWLSNASIHFSDTQVAWECKVTEFCETFPFGLPNALQDIHARFSAFSSAHAKRLKQLSKSAAKKEKELNEAQHVEDIQNAEGKLQELKLTDEEVEDSWELGKYYIWSQLIEKYARTDITRDSDRQVAVLGLGDFFSTLLNDHFISGLWFSILPSQLLWTIDSGYRSAIIHTPIAEDLSPWQPRGIRVSTRIAPTWSWASIKGPLIMPIPLKEGALVDLQIIPDQGSSEPTNLRSIKLYEKAFIIATGALHWGIMFWNGSRNLWAMMMNKVGFGSRHIFKNSVKVDIFPLPPYHETRELAQIQAAASYPFEHLHSGESDGPTENMEKEDFAFGLANPDTEVLNPNNKHPILCLPVMDTKKHGKHALHNDVSFTLNGISGLMLRPVIGGPPGMYLRVGTFDLAGDETPDLGVSFGDDGQDALFMSEEHRVIALS